MTMHNFDKSSKTEEKAYRAGGSSWDPGHSAGTVTVLHLNRISLVKTSGPSPCSHNCSPLSRYSSPFLILSSDLETQTMRSCDMWFFSESSKVATPESINDWHAGAVFKFLAKRIELEAWLGYFKFTPILNPIWSCRHWQVEWPVEWNSMISLRYRFISNLNARSRYRYRDVWYQWLRVGCHVLPLSTWNHYGSGVLLIRNSFTYTLENYCINGPVDCLAKSSKQHFSTHRRNLNYHQFIVICTSDSDFYHLERHIQVKPCLAVLTVRNDRVYLRWQIQLLAIRLQREHHR